MQQEISSIRFIEGGLSLFQCYWHYALERMCVKMCFVVKLGLKLIELENDESLLRDSSFMLF